MNKLENRLFGYQEILLQLEDILILQQLKMEFY